MGNALLNGQEVLVQHAAYVCIGLPLRGSSQDTVFVPSSPPADRTFLVKQDWELKSLPPESTDCLALSLVDRYAIKKHNHSLRDLQADNVCLTDFACLFSPAQKRNNAGDDVNDDAVGDTESDTDESVPSGRLFEQKRYTRRRQERILRYVHYKLHEDPEAYYREQLLLYYPWEASQSDPLTLSANEDASCSQAVPLFKNVTTRFAASLSRTANIMNLMIASIGMKSNELLQKLPMLTSSYFEWALANDLTMWIMSVLLMNSMILGKILA